MRVAFDMGPALPERTRQHRVEADETYLPPGDRRLLRARRLQLARAPGFRAPRARLAHGHSIELRIASNSCSAEIARYRAVQDNDLAMGHVARSVYNAMKRETEAALAACSAGRDAQAKAMVAASKQRHGYPADL